MQQTSLTQRIMSMLSLIHIYSYGFGDASYWMQLHEEMRKAGFYIKTVEESCERFAVIDQEEMCIRDRLVIGI